MAYIRIDPKSLVYETSASMFSYNTISFKQSNKIKYLFSILIKAFLKYDVPINNIKRFKLDCKTCCPDKKCINILEVRIDNYPPINIDDGGYYDLYYAFYNLYSYFYGSALVNIGSNLLNLIYTSIGIITCHLNL